MINTSEFYNFKLLCFIYRCESLIAERRRRLIYLIIYVYMFCQQVEIYVVLR